MNFSLDQSHSDLLDKSQVVVFGKALNACAKEVIKELDVIRLEGLLKLCVELGSFADLSLDDAGSVSRQGGHVSFLDQTQQDVLLEGLQRGCMNSERRHSDCLDELYASGFVDLESREDQSAVVEKHN